MMTAIILRDPGGIAAALAPEETRVMEHHYDVEAHGEMHHNPAKNVLWIARDASEIGEMAKDG